MKVGELGKLIFPQQPVSVVSCTQPKFSGLAYELTDCEYKDCEIKEIFVGAILKGTLFIEITHQGGYFNETPVR